MGTKEEKLLFLIVLWFVRTFFSFRLCIYRNCYGPIVENFHDDVSTNWACLVFSTVVLHLSFRHHVSSYFARWPSILRVGNYVSACSKVLVWLPSDKRLYLEIFVVHKLTLSTQTLGTWVGRLIEPAWQCLLPVHVLLKCYALLNLCSHADLFSLTSTSANFFEFILRQTVCTKSKLCWLLSLFFITRIEMLLLYF